jgi:hypothetical protein
LVAGAIALLHPIFAEPATPPSGPETKGDWLEGSEDEKFALISKHLRGFDATMMETGHRYTELHWAGEDANWDYAAYQLDKIRHTIELGIERRPKRSASAQGFLKGAIPHLKEAIDSKDQTMFRQRFTILTANCNACHAMEKMPFVQVRPPEHRVSPVRYETP